MHKYTIIILFLSSFLFAQSVTTSKNWLLLGATEDITDLSVFSSKCIKYLYTYNSTKNSFSIYEPSKSINEVKSIKKGTGFWLSGLDNCTIDTTKTNTFEKRIVGSDELLVDSKQSLTWVNGVDACFAGIVSKTSDSCKSLTFGGRSDWRYPTSNELSSLISRANSQGVNLNYIVSHCVHGTASDGYVYTHNHSNVGQIFTTTPSNAGLRCVSDGN